MNKILCSTGAFTGKVNGYDYRLLEPISKELICDGFELMMDSPWYDNIEALKSFLLKNNFNIPVVHCEKVIGGMISKGSEDEMTCAYRIFKTDCDVADCIGAKKLVLHLWGGMESDFNFQNNINAYSRLNELAEKYGLELLIENIICKAENPMKHLWELREKFPYVKFVFDTKMAAFHGQLELLYEKEYEWLWKEGHICHCHINDYGGGYMDWSERRTLPVGAGKIDFNRFFDFVRRNDYKGDFTVESTALDSNGIIDVDMLNEQFKYIKEKLR